MSIFGKKAAEVRKQGALDRGEFQPKGKPKAMYLYWRATQKNPPKQENFCHFWRVVALWAPLAYIRAGVRNTMSAVGNVLTSDKGALTTLILLILGFLALAAFVHPAFILVLAVPYFILGLMAASSAWNKGLDAVRASDEEMDEVTVRVFKWTAPVAYPIYGLARLLQRVSKETWDRVAVVGAIAGISMVAAYLIFLFVLLFASTGWMGLLYIAGVVGALAVLAGVVFFLSVGYDKLKRRSIRKENEYWEKVANGEIEPDAEGDPWVPGPLLSKVIGFLVAVKDFSVLAFNVVRVNKWKICPLVKID